MRRGAAYACGGDFGASLVMCHKCAIGSLLRDCSGWSEADPMPADLHKHLVSRIWFDLATCGFDVPDTALTPGHFRKG